MVFAYNFTEDVRRALVRAREEAGRLGHGYVGAEHLALGVLRTAQGRAAGLLASLDVAGVIAEIERWAQIGKSTSAQGVAFPYTSRAKRVLELAMREALELRHEAVGVEYLVLALLRERKGIGGQVLSEAGLNLEVVRVAAVQEAVHGSEHKRPTRMNRFVLRVLEWAGLIPRS